ncbi:MAG: type II toxin-antitoxin system VapC family toxin [Bacteroidota bacterium]|jgi:PIN domain nuclease of toxin-antitoxin system
MKLLIDTHAIIWYFQGDTKLTERAFRAIEDPENVICVSQASLFEISIKVSLSKLTLPCDWNELFFQFSKLGWVILPTQTTDYIALSELPFHHSDPFDRLLVSQCINQKLSILSKDNQFDKYGEFRIW